MPQRDDMVSLRLRQGVLASCGGGTAGEGAGAGAGTGVVRDAERDERINGIPTRDDAV